MTDRRIFSQEARHPTTNRRITTQFERDCVRLFDGKSAGTLERTNTLCVLKDKERIYGNPIHVSPNAKFIVLEGPEETVIVGRDYRNDGSGPAWLTHGE